jgi:thiol-disulfide isomerase/thioredoxin
MRRAQTQEAIERQIRLGLELGDPAGFDLVVVTGPTTGCPDCDPLVGKVFSISGNSKRYPSIAQLNGGPPFHDECLHNIAPHMEELQDNPPPMVGFVNTATPAQDSTPKMSKAMKWAIGIGIFLALAVIGQLMKAAR